MSERPNILWITTDHQRTDALGCYGSGWGHSPRIDELAAGGVRCDQCICQSPSCVPSRSSMWTGRYVHALGPAAYGRGEGPPRHLPLIRPFREAGYRTVQLGKYNFLNDPGALAARFDICDPGPGPGAALGPWCRPLPPDLAGDEHQFLRLPGTGLVVGGVNPLPPEQTHCQIMVRLARSFLTESPPSPFFLRLSLDVPHMPFVPLPRFYGLTDRDRIDLTLPTEEDLAARPLREIRHIRRFYCFDRLTPAELRHCRGCYYDLCAELDDAIGQVLDTLREQGLWDRTVVVLNSDHGSMLGEHGVGTIRTFYEPVVRVPLLWSWPGRLPAGAVVADPVENLDILPTLLDLAGLAMPAAIHGRSLAATLAGGPGDPHRPTFSEYDTAASPIGGADWVPRDAWWQPRHDCRVLVRQDRWKLECNYGPSDYGDDGALYDLGEDPAELRNLFDDPRCRERVASLKRVAEAWMAATPPVAKSPPPPASASAPSDAI